METEHVRKPDEDLANAIYARPLPISTFIYGSKRTGKRIMELSIWWLSASAILTWILVQEPLNSQAPRGIIVNYPGPLFASLSLYAFPLIFALVFDAYPLESIRRLLFSLREVHFGNAYIEIGDGTDSPPRKKEKPPTPPPISSEDLLVENARSSRIISEGIYRRAGVYLIVGVFVAFSGLYFFYTQTAGQQRIILAGISDNTPRSPVFSVTEILELLPNFGILFFIEIVAFFFLRQYRSAMDEFRYFEAIKRKREEVRVLFKLNQESEAKINLLDAIRDRSFFSDPTTLASGQTTEIIETRKLEKNELALVEKLIDTLSVRRA